MTFLDTKLTAVGYVKSDMKDISIPLKDNDLQLDVQVQSKQASKSATSEIIIDEDFADCLDGIDDFSHIIVIFQTNIPENARKTIKKSIQPESKKLRSKVFFQVVRLSGPILWLCPSLNL